MCSAQLNYLSDDLLQKLYSCFREDGWRPATDFTPRRLEFKGWGDWNDVRGSACDVSDVISLVTSLKANKPLDCQDRFDGDAMEQAQGCEGKMKDSCGSGRE